MRLRALFPLLVCALLTVNAPAFAKGGSHSGTHSSHAKSGTKKSTHESAAAAGVPRDSHGRIKRSAAAKDDFMRQTGYAHGRKGYVVDHITPLACGGSDSPSNMPMADERPRPRRRIAWSETAVGDDPARAVTQHELQVLRKA
jgi:hypothetical protein